MLRLTHSSTIATTSASTGSRTSIADLVEVLRPRLENEPMPGRRRRMLSTILMPADPPADGARDIRDEQP